MRPRVFLDRARDYPSSPAVIAKLMNLAGPSLRPGDRVLVKPNLVAGKNARLSCTHPVVVAEVCSFLKEYGVRISVGDSPAFGSAVSVAEAAGMKAPLAAMGIQIRTLKADVVRELNGAKVSLSRTALESDLILNIPKLKAHSQMRITAGVKNLFGCVTGVRKALLHATHGDKGNRFQALIVDIMLSLPPQVTLIDGITAMHETGPINGTEHRLGLLACSDNTVAADGAVCRVLGLSSHEIPVWDECCRRGLVGADPERNEYPLLHPENVRIHDFQVPGVLKPQSFSPPQLLRSGVRRLWTRCFS